MEARKDSQFKPLIYKNVKEGLYLIDEFGNIWSNYKRGYLIPSSDKNGYLKVNLSTGVRDKKCCAKIATLVAWHYISPPPNNLKDPTINHIDGNIKQNHYSNLEWTERGVNSSIRNNKGKGSSNSSAILTEKQVVEICELLVTTQLSFSEIGEKYNVKPTTIANIHSKNTWKEITNLYPLPCRITIRNKRGQYESKNILLPEVVD